MKPQTPKKNCEHHFAIFRHSDYSNSGYLTFYCRKCLKFVKKYKKVDIEEAKDE